MAKKDKETSEPEKFDLRSHDTASDKISELLRLFPEIRTEGGMLDFDRLKLALGESVALTFLQYVRYWL
jgi:adenine-specific DNA-methyltransferase